MRTGAGTLRAATKSPITFAGARDLCSHTGVDAVIICSPNEFHADQAILALTAGKHVLVEKPMADNAADAAKMADAARRAGRVLALGHTFRHCRASATCRTICRTSALCGPRKFPCA